MQEISEQAAYYAQTYCPTPPVLPQVIADELGLSFRLDNYGNAFDGVLDYTRERKFYVFLNVTENDNLYTPRVRFSFAHELGHFIIDEHRNGIMKHRLPVHGSVATLDSDIEIEREADMFAACLLMPENQIKRDLYGKKFTFALIDEISRKYLVSLTAAILRFIALGNHPVMLVCSQAGRLKWLRYSEDFPFKQLNLTPGKGVPVNTCAFEFFDDGRKYRSTETVYADDWFVLYRATDRRRAFNEYCIYYESLNQVISLLWE
jgi:hypothetical protein